MQVSKPTYSDGGQHEPATGMKCGFETADEEHIQGCTLKQSSGCPGHVGLGVQDLAVEAITGREPHVESGSQMVH